ILPKEVSEFATPVIQSTITGSLENVFLAKSSSQLKSTYEVAASLTEFELKKILLENMQKSKSYRGAQKHRELYDGLVKSYKLDKDLFESYGKAYFLKSDCEDKEKDEDPPAGSDQGLKKGRQARMLNHQKALNQKNQSQPYPNAPSLSQIHLRRLKFEKKIRSSASSKEGKFPRLNLRDIEDMLLLLVQKKISNLERDVIFNLNVALWMFTRRVFILKRVEDLQLGVKRY
nr:hypothetical protein [Tanacetum cinerariifolium]